jgi:hypothetical protein
MRRLLALALVVALVSLGVPTASFAGARTTSSVAGVVKDMTGSPLANTTVRLRSVLTGQLAGTTRTSIAGAFAFENLTSGNYIVETVDANGRIVAASSSVDVAPGASMTGVAVTAPGDAKQAGAAAAGAAGGSFFTSTTGIILLAAIGAGVVAGVVVATRDSSPSK